MKEYYSRLFLKDGSSKQEVKRAYRKLVKKFHPDKNKESDEYTEEFKLIQEAYEKLMAYFDSKQGHTYAYTEPEKKSSSESGVVRSDAKFAEEGEKNVNQWFLNVIIQGLILIVIILTVIASFNQKTLLMQIVLSVLVAPSILVLIYGTYKKITSRVNME